MHQILNRIHFFLLIALVWSLSFSFPHLQLTGLLVILLTVSVIPLLAPWKGRPQSIKIMFLFVSVYLIYVSGLFYSKNVDGASFELEKKLSMLILPLVLFYSPKLGMPEQRIVLLTFVATCLLTLLFCLSVAGYKWYLGNGTGFFFYHDLSQIAGMHAAYLSMYCCFSIVILLVLYHHDAIPGRSRRVLVYPALSVLVLGIFLLSARMQLVIFFIGLFAYTYIQLVRKVGRVWATVSGLGIGMAALVVTLLFPVNLERFKQAINYKNQYSINSKWGEQQMRPLVWSCAFEVIKSAPMIGVGIGDGQEELQSCYLRNKFGSLTYFPNMRFNAHNQFLETTVQLGIIGLLVLCLSMGIPFFLSLQDKNILYSLFLLIFVLSCLTESMLERQSGIIFFSFFNSFLFLNQIKR